MKATHVGRQVIETKHLGPTNHRVARIKVSADTGKSIIIPWDHDLTVADNHACACLRFQSIMDWNDDRVGSQLADGRFVWVCK